MSKPHLDHGDVTHGDASDTDGHRIESATDEIFARAQDAVRDVADRATHLAQDTLDRGRVGIRKVERSSRRGHPNGGGRPGTSPFATALAVGAMGYAIATLIQGATRKRRVNPANAVPDKVMPAAPAG
ncbi:hypothetical protein [Methylobacterium persicinum]|uniref:DUF3618 domain-containing protein n=1 Tax=Methylobacterium persicinum TaxID=374426 RepID=A0ABU0HTU7_9HYPH|nr:hypothetical protein [Methylobacterium persicinum]MDQ0445347.1 hypothetical protein [Methylobacterium persicinum]GJE40276.1 hypothetical protein KHHGKMAE_4367 [Methylobacterium persicinum]